MPFLFLHYPGESNCLVFTFAWLPMYLVIQSKMGKCHLNAFKLIQYTINLVLWNSSLLECFDLHSEESPLSVPYHCFHGDPFPILLGIAVSDFSGGAPFPKPHAFLLLFSLIWVMLLLHHLPKEEFMGNIET